MRVRKAAYEMSIRQREAHSGHVVAEPQKNNPSGFVSGSAESVVSCTVVPNRGTA